MVQVLLSEQLMKMEWQGIQKKNIRLSNERLIEQENVVCQIMSYFLIH